MGKWSSSNSGRRCGIPTVATWCAADLVPSDDPTYVGRPGSVAARGANFALQNSDFLLAIGVRLDFAIPATLRRIWRAKHTKWLSISTQQSLQKLHPYIQQPICRMRKHFCGSC